VNSTLVPDFVPGGAILPRRPARSSTHEPPDEDDVLQDGQDRCAEPACPERSVCAGRRRSIDQFKHRLRRAERLASPRLVLHDGDDDVGVECPDAQRLGRVHHAIAPFRRQRRPLELSVRPRGKHPPGISRLKRAVPGRGAILRSDRALRIAQSARTRRGGLIVSADEAQLRMRIWCVHESRLRLFEVSLILLHAARCSARRRSRAPQSTAARRRCKCIPPAAKCYRITRNGRKKFTRQRRDRLDHAVSPAAR